MRTAAAKADKTVHELHNKLKGSTTPSWPAKVPGHHRFHASVQIFNHK